MTLREEKEKAQFFTGPDLLVTCPCTNFVVKQSRLLKLIERIDRLMVVRFVIDPPNAPTFQSLLQELKSTEFQFPPGKM
jgi:hypothetical protein